MEEKLDTASELIEAQELVSVRLADMSHNRAEPGTSEISGVWSA